MTFPRFHQPLTVFVLLTIAWGRAAAGQPPIEIGVPVVPQDVADILHWFPTDTETLIVARDVEFKLKSKFTKAKTTAKLTDDQRHELRQQLMVWLTKSLALGRLPQLGNGDFLRTGKLVDKFGEAHVPLVVYGGRGYEVVSAFGSYRWHGCSVLVFAEDATDVVTQIMQSVGEDSPEVRKIRDEEVFVFPADKSEMESIYELKPWQGTYLARIKPNVLLCATSDVYLEEVLERIGTKPADRLSPAELPEWKYVDTTSSVWGLRHIPAVKAQKLAGLVWQTEPGGRQTFEAFYLPARGGDVKKPSQSWFLKPSDNGELKIPAELGDRIQRLPDGTTKVTVELDQIVVDFPLFQLYHLQGYPGTWRSDSQ